MPRTSYDEMAVIGSPVGGAGGDPGDPGCILHAYYFIPTGTAPFPFVAITHAAGFSTGGLDALTTSIAVDLKAQGYFVAFFETRLMLGGATGGPGLPGQTTDGRFQQITNDAFQAITFLRAEPRCMGFVAAMGGSGSGYEALFIAVNGVPGTTRPDASICLSPVTDMGDRQADTNNGNFIAIVSDYGRVDPTDMSPPTLAFLTSESPIAGISTSQAPVYHYNGGMEAMPASQWNLFSAAVAAKSINNYTGDFIPTSGEHSFGAWAGPQAMVRVRALPWLDTQLANWLAGGGGGGGGTPPPTTGIDHYEYLITGGPVSFAGNVDGTLDTVTVTGLPPGILMSFFLRAWNQWGPSVWDQYNFTTDRAQGGGGGGPGGRVPIGIVDLLPTDDTGQLPGIAGLPIWANPNIIGCRLHTQWQILQPLSGSATDTSLIETFLNLCKANRKRGCISVGVGSGTPTWALPGLSVYTDSDSVTFPVPWDPNYITLVNALIATLGGIYDGDTRLSHFVTALGSYGTTAQSYVINPNASNSGADFANLTTLSGMAGFSSVVAGWEVFAKSALQAYGRAFPTTSMMADLYYAVPPTDDLGQQSVTDLVVFVNGAFASRACLMDELLDENLLNGMEPDFDFIDNLVIAANQYAFSTRGVSGSIDEFQSWMTAGIAAAPNYIEITDSDANQSGYQTIIATTAMALRTARMMKQGG